MSTWPTWVWVVGWLVCGFFAYGIHKGNWRDFYKGLEYVGYTGVSEIFPLTFFVSGPIGLFVAILISLSSLGLSFCLVMPKDLKEPRPAEFELQKKELEMRKLEEEAEKFEANVARKVAEANNPEMIKMLKEAAESNTDFAPFAASLVKKIEAQQKGE